MGHFSDQLCTAGVLGPHGPHLVKHDVFGYARRQSMSLSACRLLGGCFRDAPSAAGLGSSFTSDLYCWIRNSCRRQSGCAILN